MKKKRRENSFEALLNSNMLDKDLIINTIIEYSQDTFYFKDLESRFIFISKNVASRLGIINPADLIGKTDFDIFDECHAKAAFDDEQRIISSGEPIINKVEKEVWLNGNTVWVSTSKYPLLDNNGNIIGTWGISRDITAIKHAEENLIEMNKQIIQANLTLEMMAKLDSISNLYNNRHFYEEIQKLFVKYAHQSDKSSKVDFSIILFDIDNFKSINDMYGHMAGDYAIKHVADILKNNIRDEDRAFRYGGDEFAVLLPNLSIYEASVIAEKIRKRVSERPLIINNNKISVSISGGLASLEEAKNVNELMTIADKRLYQSKGKGKNRISL
ncbi:MAG: sensor domain-containing diguanylate cyclase [Bacillota bacterium]